MWTCNDVTEGQEEGSAGVAGESKAGPSSRTQGLRGAAWNAGAGALAPR